jgi:uncharacterized protein (UPF0332 family)
VTAAFSWRTYLRLAESLVEPSSGRDEAALRSAASRAYYAAFNLALEWAAAESIDTSPHDDECGNSHQACWRAFREHGDKNLRKVGTEGRDLRDIRVQADYHSYLSDPEALAEEAIDSAKRILNRLTY